MLFAEETAGAGDWKRCDEYPALGYLTLGDTSRWFMEGYWTGTYTISGNTQSGLTLCEWPSVTLSVNSDSGTTTIDITGQVAFSFVLSMSVDTS